MRQLICACLTALRDKVNSCLLTIRPPECPDRRDQNGGDRLIFGLFMAGEVVMMDTADRANLKQLSVVSVGKDAGPHNLVLSSDDNRLVVSDYFLKEDTAGIIHFEGDHKIHVLKLTHDALTEDTRFNLDFNTAFSTARRVLTPPSAERRGWRSGRRNRRSWRAPGERRPGEPRSARSPGRSPRPGSPG